MDSRSSRYRLRSRDVFEDGQNASNDYEAASSSFELERSPESQDNDTNAWLQQHQAAWGRTVALTTKKVTFSTNNSSSNHRRVAAVKAYSHMNASVIDASTSSGDSESSKTGSIIGILKKSAIASPNDVAQATTASAAAEDRADLDTTANRTSSRCSTPEERVAFAMEMAEKDESVKRCLEFYKTKGEWWNALPKTDYTYSSLSRHRQEVSPGIIALPNMSRRRSSSQGTGCLFSSSSTSSYDTADYNHFVHTSTRSSNVQTSVFTRILSFIWLFISSSVVSITKYWSGMSTPNVYELRTPQRYVGRRSLLQQMGSSLYRLFSLIYRCILHVMLLDTWLLSRLRSNAGRPPRLVTLWPLLLLLLVLAGWFLNEWQFLPTFLTARTDQMISGEKAFSKSVGSMLPTFPNVQRIFLDVLLAPWSVLVGLWTWVCSMGSILLSLMSLLSFSTFQGPSEATVPEVPPVFDSKQNIGVNLENVQGQSPSLKVGDKILMAEISRLRRDFEDLKTSQKVWKDRDVDMRNVENLMMEKENSFREVFDGIQRSLKIQIDGLHEELKMKVDADALDKKLDRIRVQQGVLFAELHEVQTDMKNALDNSHLCSKLAGEGQETLRKLILLQMQMDELRQKADNCCEKLTSGQLKEDIKIELMHVLHTISPSAYDDADLRKWIRSTFVSKDDLDVALAKVTESFNEELRRRESILLKASAEEMSARIAKYEYEHHAHFDSTWQNVGSNDEWQIRRIVENVIAIYDADKTGMSDFALESQGGEVISTRCSETYHKTAPSLSVLGIPLWYPSNSPRTVIQPGMHPGDCWAFAGSQGYLVVRLSHMIHVKGFSYEHVPAALLPTGQIDSAPKNFEVFGLREEIDKEPLFLGKYQYFENETSLQYFAVEASGVHPLQLIELHITSNHGNINYTCLYRFRVHGKIA